jgi:RimJ/RimL family protein N-acetyltransferase
VPPFPTELDLTSDGFRLRRLVAGDAPALARLRQDEEARRWTNASGGTVRDAEEAIAAAGRMWAEGEAVELAIVSLDDETKLLGGIDLRFYGAARASIGYSLAPEARGQGIATRALRLLSNWAFATFDELVRLELWILPGNEASFRVAERAGFQREGVLRSRLAVVGEFRDVVSYSLLRTDSRLSSQQ